MKKEEVTYELILEQLGDKLPSLPQILEDLVKTLGDLNVTLDLIEEQIQIDQSISLEILKIVNKVEFLEPHESRLPPFMKQSTNWVSKTFKRSF